MQPLWSDLISYSTNFYGVNGNVKCSRCESHWVFGKLGHCPWTILFIILLYPALQMLDIFLSLCVRCWFVVRPSKALLGLVPSVCVRYLLIVWFVNFFSKCYFSYSYEPILLIFHVNHLCKVPHSACARLDDLAIFGYLAILFFF